MTGYRGNVEIRFWSDRRASLTRVVAPGDVLSGLSILVLTLHESYGPAEPKEKVLWNKIGHCTEYDLFKNPQKYQKHDPQERFCAPSSRHNFTLISTCADVKTWLVISSRPKPKKPNDQNTASNLAE
jgi:hypothetical protein